MATIFTRIIEGELPGRFVWRDEAAVGFLTIEPIRPGHTLVVPRVEVDHWVDLEPGVAAHLMGVAHAVGRGLMEAFGPPRVGLIIAGLEVPHTHLHAIPMHTMADLDFVNADRNADGADLDAAADRLRDALRDLGYAAASS